MIKPFETDYSFPSGHTIGITVFLMVIGYLICSRRPGTIRAIIWIAVTMLGILAVSASRLYLGYHWLTDVIASVGLGLIVLAITIPIDRQFVDRSKKLK
jgi:undecaprenyl-diphosphatase